MKATINGLDIDATGAYVTVGDTGHEMVFVLADLLEDHGNEKTYRLERVE